MNKPDGIAKQLKIVRIGDEVGVVLPAELLARLQLEVGDFLSLVETPGGMTLSTEDAEFAQAMELAEQIMEEDREILRVLAK
jgi:putative addiction module antidote